jgi:ankyrin repeat protein
MRAGLTGVLVLTAALGVSAAEPDLRLVQAVAERDRATTKALLDARVDVNTARADGATALLWAAHWDDLELVDRLLAARANVNAADDRGVTPLARACENTSVTMVTRLLGAGADPNRAQTSGLTPLMIAARTGNLDVVTALLAKGAKVNAATEDARATALMWALSANHDEIARTLIAGGASVGGSTTKGFTPLMFAARNGDVEMGKALVAAGADVNALSADGTHVLAYAAMQGQEGFAMFLLESGANSNATLDGVPALHAAAGSVSQWVIEWQRRHGASNGPLAFALGASGGATGRVRLVKALLAKGADPNGRITTSTMSMAYIGFPKKGAFEQYATGTGDMRGATPLWVAAYSANGGGFLGGGMAPGATSSSGEVLKALLAAGADPNLTTVDGTTPLMVAAGMGRATFQPGLQRGRRSPTAEEAVNILLDAGSNVNAVNEADFAAIHGAAFRGLNEVIEILVKRGADINARDYRGRTPYRIAEGAKQSFQFQAYPETAEFIKSLGANTRLGVPGTVQERARDLVTEAAELRSAPAGQP